MCRWAALRGPWVADSEGPLKFEDKNGGLLERAVSGIHGQSPSGWCGALHLEGDDTVL